jgi:peroxiredoxin Q/BCP
MSGKSSTSIPAADRRAGQAQDRRARLAAARQAQRRAERRRRAGIRAVIGAVLVAVVAGLYLTFHHADTAAPGAGAYPYQVASPGQGSAAPGFTLAASTGRRVSLSAYRGKSVLLFFQEGLTCQPCWNQISDLQQHAAQLRAAGISDVVSVTGDPIGPITQKAHDMGLTIPVLADPGLAVSQAYHANADTMMGGSTDGHTFILVGPDGKIRWRADYGGAPNYVMYLPTSALLADIKAGEHPS